MSDHSGEENHSDEMWINGYESFNTGIKQEANFTKIYTIGRHLLIGHWYRNEAEVNHHYSAAWILLPIGSIFITAMVVLLMVKILVLFNRCPQIIAAVVTGILGAIILFMIFMLLNEKTIYI